MVESINRNLIKTFVAKFYNSNFEISFKTIVRERKPYRGHNFQWSNFIKFYFIDLMYLIDLKVLNCD